MPTHYLGTLMGTGKRTVETNSGWSPSLLLAGRLPLYLHCLNRELLRSLDQSLSEQAIRDVLLFAALTSDQSLYASIAFVWESGLLDGRLFPLLKQLLIGRHLQLISRFPTLDGFIASARHLYSHDKGRYPMYFGEPSQQYLIATPTLLKAENTTEALRRDLQSFAENPAGSLSQLLAPSDVGLLMGIRPLMTRLASGRFHEKAITLSAIGEWWRGRRLKGARLAAGRLISTAHLQHYLEFLRADIVTGVPSLEYYDSAAVQFPRNDFQYAGAVLRHAGLDRQRVSAWWQEIVEARAGEEHRLFVGMLHWLVEGLYFVLSQETQRHSMIRDPGSVESTAHALFGSNRPGPQGWSDLGGFSGAFDRLAYLALRAERHIAFKTFQQRYESMANTTQVARVLVLVATEIERNVFIEMASRIYNLKYSRDFVGDHTVFFLGHLGGAELLLAKSGMGTEAPHGMTLTASDLVDNLRPDYVVLVGIGFGLKPERQKIGDVLVSRQVQLCDLRKVTDDREILRGDKAQASTLLLDRFENAEVEWTGPTIHVGLILSANVLANSLALIEELRIEHPDAIGGEMEGSGVYCVASKRRIDWIIVKGISDWGFDKDDKNQSVAATNAVSYMLYTVAMGGLAQIRQS